MRIWLTGIYTILLFWASTTTAQERSVISDTSDIQLVERTIPESRISDYTKRPEYAYRKSILYETNIFKRYWNAFKRWLNNALGTTSQSGLDTILFYLAIILAILGLIYHLMKSSYNNPWHRKLVREGEASVVIINDEGSGHLIKSKIEELETKGDLRQALRFRFIYAVWKLNDRGIIDWQPEMTNYNILRRISSPQIKTAFKSLVSIYEHIWYGDYPIGTPHQYAAFQSEFESFHEKIKLLS